MKNLFTFIFLSFTLLLSAQDALNVELFGQFNRGDERYSGSWSYIAPDGSEYALIGAKTGMAVYSIDDASDIQELGFIPGPATNWREITVLGQHAYITTDVQDTSHSMQVVDLSDLPNSISLVTSYDETFQMGHIIQRDIYSEAPYVYVHGADTDDGTHIIDVSDPANPVEVGVYAPGYYIHDGHVKGDYLYAAAFFEDKIDVVDISDKTNPTLIASIPDPGNNTHSSWLTEDDKYLFVADEQDGVESSIINVEDFTDPTPVARILANGVSLLHNPYIRGDWAFCSHNTEGLRIYDIADPTLPVEVGYYDTFSGPSGGFSGLWSACPYFPSGKIIGGDRTEGLFIWTFNDTRAARFSGIVRDSISGEILPNAIVELISNSTNLPLNAQAEFRYGDLAGNFEVSANLAGYDEKSVSFTLSEGETGEYDIELVPDDYVSSLSNLDEKILKVSPNPFTTFASIEIPQDFQEGVIEVKNTYGQTLQSIPFYGNQYQTIDGSLLVSGIYFIEVTAQDNRRTLAKVIKK